MNEEKAYLRRVLGAEPLFGEASERERADSEICRVLLQDVGIANFACVAMYCATGHEPCLGVLIDTLLEVRQAAVCLPRRADDVEGGLSYDLAGISSRSELVEGSFGIPEPSPETPGVEPGEVDAWLVPGLAFAPDGCRLGRGGGVYDRLLRGVPGLRIGVCYSSRLREDIPRDVHDVLMNKIVTEKGVVEIV